MRPIGKFTTMNAKTKGSARKMIRWRESIVVDMKNVEATWLAT